MPKKDRLVFSVGPSGSSSHRSGGPSGAGPAVSEPPARQAPRVRRERSGRKGKTVTVAGPFRLTKDDATALLGELKRSCGGGGALKAIEDREGRPAFSLEVQGDHRDAVVELLVKRGYPAKPAGG
jgi:translation initiation factor 1